jgi:hypothetical protein
VQFVIGNLPSGVLGEADVAADTVFISDNAAGWGWFVDSNAATDGSGPATFNGMDLLTTVLHEMGHFAGLGDLPSSSGNNVMDGFLGVGSRHVAALDAFFASH